MTDFLLELRSEEIPARMQDKAREDLARLFAAEMAKAGLAATDIVTYVTPRRLALIARDLPEQTEAVSEEVKGPKASAPPQALEGFLRKTGLTRDQLTERDGIFFAITEKPGRATLDVLAEAIPAIVRAFPWPKSMRWGAPSISTESPRWVRPLHGIVALLGDAIVPCEVAGVTSGAATLGHRFHHPYQITIGGAHDYVEKLRACHVIVDQDERRALIRDRAETLAAEAGLELIADEGLVAENAGLTEWPVPLLGHFDADFLGVPPEVIQLTARVNQKYFVCRDASGALANAFVCVANIDAIDGGAAIVAGNQKVLAARLADARFFYETDLKVPLEAQAAKLDRIVFHEKLGTVADKVDRVAKLAKWLVEEGIVGADGDAPPTPFVSSEVEKRAPNAAQRVSTALDTNGEEDRAHLAALAERAARLCKADLVTGMVGEFPELQGVIGGYYAAAQGEDPQVAAAIRGHYKPVGQGDDVPIEPVTVAVSLADKLDTLLGFFLVGEIPSGSRDPFALRRAALGAISIIVVNRLKLFWDDDLSDLVGNFFEPIEHPYGTPDVAWVNETALLRDPNVRKLWSRQKVEYWRGEELLLAVGRSRVATEDEHDRRVAVVWDGFGKLQDFVRERLKVQQREGGVRADLIDAAARYGYRFLDGSIQFIEDTNVLRLLARSRALQSFMATDDGANLLTGYRRAANILKKEGWEPSPPTSVTPADAGVHRADSAGGEMDRGLRRDEQGGSAATPPQPVHKSLPYTPEPVEQALIDALDAAEPAAASAVAAEDFARAMTALASLRAPIDAFFETVTVNDPDAAKRAARLALLARVRAAVHTVADFSKIEG